MQVFDAIIVGAGGMGSAAAYQLSKRGAHVLILDQFEFGNSRGSSHGETRMIRRAYFEHADYVPLLNRAYKLWQELQTEAGATILTKNGLVIYGDAETSSVYKGSIESARRHDIPIETLDAAQAAERFPLFRSQNLSAVYEPGAGYLHVERACLSHLGLARGRGAVLKEREKMITFREMNGGVEVTTNRSSYYGRKLILAGGAWSKELMAGTGIPLELFRVNQYWFKASKAHVEAPCFAFHHYEDFIYGFPSLDGKTIKLARHFVKTPIAQPEDKALIEPPELEVETLRMFIEEHLPEVSTQLDRFAPCMYTMTSDEHFVIDQHPNHRNVFFAAGFSGHGFKFASVVGEILADLVQNGHTDLPIDFLRNRELARP